MSQLDTARATMTDGAEAIARLATAVAAGRASSLPPVHRKWWQRHTLHRELHENGFHPSLATITQAPGTRLCLSWAALEQLPAGAYLDPYELQRRAQFDELGGAQGALVLQDVDLESVASALHSTPLQALVYGQISPSNRTIRSAVPLHLRYNAPSATDTHRLVELPPPRLFVCCSGGSFWRRAQAPCTWRRVPRLRGDTLYAKVPVGQLAHTAPVLALHQLAIWGGWLGLLRTIHHHPGVRVPFTPETRSAATELRERE